MLHIQQSIYAGIAIKRMYTQSTNTHIPTLNALRELQLNNYSANNNKIINFDSNVDNFAKEMRNKG